MSAIDALGYAASALVILSLSMRSVVRLRMISLCGSAAFLVYGVLIEAPPIIITNLCIAALNIWFLRREFARSTSERSDLGVSRIRPDSPFLLDFVEFHLDDIRSFQPNFSMPAAHDDDSATSEVISLLLTRDGLPAGLLVGRRQGERGEALRIDLDYVLREHRDSRLGTWLFGRGASVFAANGVAEKRADASTLEHHRYLRRVGFSPAEPRDPNRYELVVATATALR